MIEYSKVLYMEAFIEWWMSTIGQVISPRLSVFIISMLPVIEERGGLILARMLDIPLWEGVIYCVLGNIVPVPFILLLLEKVIDWLSAHHLSKIAEMIKNKAIKNKPKIDKYGFWGLMIFVGIPLPGTGAWTGTMVAALFNMDVKKSVLSIFLGIILAAIIMTIVSYGLLGQLIS